MGKKDNKTHQSPANVHWSDDEQTIYYMGKPVQLARIRGMIQAMTEELQTAVQVMTFHAPVPPIDLDQIIDSMAWSEAFRRQNYSFIQHPDNPHQIKMEHEFLLQQAQKPGQQRWHLLRKNPTTSHLEWVPNQVKQYQSFERRFLRSLMVLMHITGGQPARGPELGSIKVSNSIYSARNIYVINGRICFLTMYDKARKRRGNTEYIIRCLPPAVGQIIVQYLVYVRPFARVLDRRESEYLFGDQQGPWAGEELSRALSQATTKHLGVRLTVSAWRHVAIGIATRHLTRASRTWEKVETDPDDEADEFAGGDDEEELELDTFRHVMVR